VKCRGLGFFPQNADQLLTIAKEIIRLEVPQIELELSCPPMTLSNSQERFRACISSITNMSISLGK